MRVSGWLVTVLVTALAWTPLPAQGRVEARTGHSKARTYHAALRYLRVDLGYQVTEKDAKAAYLLFEYTAPNRKTVTHGSIEIIETDETVRVYVQVPSMPRYHEQVLSDGLMKKLREEYGEPAPKQPAPAEPEPDGGA